jgi:hypothetical protein
MRAVSYCQMDGLLTILETPAETISLWLSFELCRLLIERTLNILWTVLSVIKPLSVISAVLL